MASTDPDQASDHPARLVRDLYDSLPVYHSDRTGAFRAAEVLRSYEREHDVTFVALHNNTLADVRAAYEALYTPDGHLRTHPDVRPLATALASLLDLDGES